MLIRWNRSGIYFLSGVITTSDLGRHRVISAGSYVASKTLPPRRPLSGNAYYWCEPLLGLIHTRETKHFTPFLRLDINII